MKLVKAGVYTLIETPKGTKILTLNKNYVYAWIRTDKMGEMLVWSKNPHRTYDTLALGRFRLYELDSTPYYTRQFLELEVGRSSWQSYVLPAGLPYEGKWRSKIIPAIAVEGTPSVLRFWEAQFNRVGAGV